MALATILRSAVSAGTVAAATSCAALAAVALVEGKGAAQPFNATSHWLNGDAAAQRRDVDLVHTGVGLLTHGAATVFWAAFFEAWCSARPTRGTGTLAGRAAAVSALAAAVDYTITPKRFTPGWELVLSKPAMALVYAAMAGGFLASRRALTRRHVPLAARGPAPDGRRHRARAIRRPPG